MKTCSLLLLFCFASVQSKTTGIPDPPSSPIGPFDLRSREGNTFISPQGDDKEDGYNTKTMFQGDIIDPGRTKGGKIGQAGTRTPWPDAIIPYVFDCSVLSIKSAVKATYDAMEEWEKRTCVRFVKKQPHHKVYLEFIRAAGCWATYVGYKGKKTQISIGNGCDFKHVMIHELGHVIGFWHEQSRPDRDNYITIDYGNVYSSLRYNFDIVKEQVNNYGEPYDFNSIMHYPFNAFAIDKRRNTIYPRDNRILGTARPYRGLSEIDVRQTRKMYQCDKIASARAVTMKSITDASQRIGALTLGENCRDQNVYCKSWADADFCALSPDPMLKVCPESCGVCGKKCEDSESYRSDCPAWADYGFCVPGAKTTDHILTFMNTNCMKSCGVCTSAPVTKPTTKPTTTLPPTTTSRPTTTSPATTPEITTKSPTTLQTTTVSSTIGKPDGNFTGIRCQDRSKYCGAWANDGRCKTDRWVYDNCLLSCKRFTVCDKEMIKPTGLCSEPLGVYSNKIISDNRMYGSSIFSPGGGWYAPASSGRLYKEDDSVKKHIGAWCAAPNNNRKQYLEIDFGEKKRITALATQGRDVYFEHVKSYSLAFSDDRRIWNDYREGGVEKVFDGNCDHVTPVLNILKTAQNARYIRIYPIRKIGAACLRVEVYGCK